MSVSMRKPIIWFTLVCFVATQTAALGAPDPHAEGVAAGQAANPVARGSITAPGASAGLVRPLRASEKMVVFAHDRPNTTMSRRLFAPSRLAPCTLAHAASPAASSPGTIASSYPALGFTTSPVQSVGTPPML